MRIVDANKYILLYDTTFGALVAWKNTMSNCFAIRIFRVLRGQCGPFAISLQSAHRILSFSLSYCTLTDEHSDPLPPVNQNQICIEIISRNLYFYSICWEQIQT